MILYVEIVCRCFEEVRRLRFGAETRLTGSPEGVRLALSNERGAVTCHKCLFLGIVSRDGAFAEDAMAKNCKDGWMIQFILE
jgi:hypothetical protein